MTNPTNNTQDPSNNSSGVVLQATTGASSVGSKSSGGHVNTSAIMILVLQTMTKCLGGLNTFLQSTAKNVLSADLKEDAAYADQLSNARLDTKHYSGTGATAKAKNSAIATKNGAIMAYQQVIQARLKVHQNSEQTDMQMGSTTTSNIQQIASMLSSTIDLLTQVFGSINSINR